VKIRITVTSNYWACSEKEFLFEFAQKVVDREIVTEHWYTDETNGFEHEIKMARKKELEVSL